MMIQEERRELFETPCLKASYFLSKDTRSPLRPCNGAKHTRRWVSGAQCSSWNAQLVTKFGFEFELGYNDPTKTHNLCKIPEIPSGRRFTYQLCSYNSPSLAPSPAALTSSADKLSGNFAAARAFCEEVKVLSDLSGV